MRFRERAEDVIERRRRDGVDGRAAISIELGMPAAAHRVVEIEGLQPRQRLPGLGSGAFFAAFGLRDPGLRQFRLRPELARRLGDVAVAVALVGEAAASIAVAQQRWHQRRAMPAGRTAGDALEALQQPGPLGEVPGFDPCGEDVGPVVLVVLAKGCRAAVKQVGGEQAEELAGALLEHRLAGGVEQGDHRLEQVHLRVLPPWRLRRQLLDEAAMGRAQLAIEEQEAAVDLGADLRVAGQPQQGRLRQQHEGEVVGIALGIQHAAVGGGQMRKAVLGVGAAQLQELLQPVQRDLPGVRVPVELGRLGIAVDLPRLHEGPARGVAVGRSVRAKPLDEAAMGGIPARRRPKGQGLFGHPGAEGGDGVVVCLRVHGGIFRAGVGAAPAVSGPRSLHAVSARNGLALILRQKPAYCAVSSPRQ